MEKTTQRVGGMTREYQEQEVRKYGNAWTTRFFFDECWVKRMLGKRVNKHGKKLKWLDLKCVCVGGGVATINPRLCKPAKEKWV